MLFTVGKGTVHTHYKASQINLNKKKKMLLLLAANRRKEEVAGHKSDYGAAGFPPSR